jgi:hypothetical protein
MYVTKQPFAQPDSVLFSLMFHPDNIKNFTLDGVPVSISLHQYWAIIGGPQGLAKALNTSVKVSVLWVSNF